MASSRQSVELDSMKAKDAPLPRRGQCRWHQTFAGALVERSTGTCTYDGRRHALSPVSCEMLLQAWPVVEWQRVGTAALTACGVSG